MHSPDTDHPELLERYRRGELTAEDEERFEELLLTDAAFQDAVEADLRFADALRSLGDAGELPAPAVGGDLADRRRPRRWQPLAWAASIALALLPALFLMRENAPLTNAARAADQAAAEVDALRRQLDDATRPRAHLPLVRLSPVRSDAEAPYRIRPGEDPEWVVLVVEPPEPLAPPYAIALEDGDGATVWTGDAVQLDAYGTLTLSFYSPQLADGRHRLRATGDDGATFHTAFDIRR
ncbi:MAG: hypothetical protein AAGM22_20530 [Acidobacteriota bacterium]